MSITTEEIRKMKPGSIEPFLCNGGEMFSVATTLSKIKRTGLPEGVVDFEHQKFFDRGIIVIHAMREGDQFVLNR